MAGGIRVNLVAVARGEITGLQETGAERYDLVMSAGWIVDMEIEVDLLFGCAVRPVGR